ncbi:MAG: hypothetical protein F6K26_30380, partial [Moorea sp. SIO2I5]|nr:hypothetical protein [Moorena sp. SIO2I5]
MQRGLGGFPHERLHQDGNRGSTERLPRKRKLCFLITDCSVYRSYEVHIIFSFFPAPCSLLPAPC